MAPLVAGTLNLTGVTASSSYSTGALTVGGGLGVTGALYTNSTANFAGSVTSAGIISSAAIGINNSAGLTTTQTSINIFNNDATTINFGGLATSGNFGYSSTGSSTTNISTGVAGFPATPYQTLAAVSFAASLTSLFPSLTRISKVSIGVDRFDATPQRTCSSESVARRWSEYKGVEVLWAVMVRTRTSGSTASCANTSGSVVSYHAGLWRIFTSGT